MLPDCFLVNYYLDDRFDSNFKPSNVNIAKVVKNSLNQILNVVARPE